MASKKDSSREKPANRAPASKDVETTAQPNLVVKERRRLQRPLPVPEVSEVDGDDAQKLWDQFARTQPGSISER